MRLFGRGVYLAISVAAVVLGLWIVFGPSSPAGNAELGAIIALIFVFPSLGMCWMLYYCIRYEEKPLPFVFLALIPYAFLWYYFRRGGQTHLRGWRRPFRSAS